MKKKKREMDTQIRERRIRGGRHRETRRRRRWSGRKREKMEEIETD